MAFVAWSCEPNSLVSKTKYGISVYSSLVVGYMGILLTCRGIHVLTVLDEESRITGVRVPDFLSDKRRVWTCVCAYCMCVYFQIVDMLEDRETPEHVQCVVIIPIFHLSVADEALPLTGNGLDILHPIQYYVVKTISS